MSFPKIYEKTYNDVDKEVQTDFRTFEHDVRASFLNFKERLDALKRNGDKKDKWQKEKDKVDHMKKWIAENMKTLSKNLKQYLDVAIEEANPKSSKPQYKHKQQPSGNKDSLIAVEGTPISGRESPSISNNSSSSDKHSSQTTAPGTHRLGMMSSMKEQLRDKEEQIENWKKQLQSKDGTINHLQQQNEYNEGRIKALEGEKKEYATKHKDMARAYEDERKKGKRLVAEMAKEIRDRDEEIKKLKTEKNDLSSRLLKYVDGASLSESMTDGHEEYVEPECSSCENAKRRLLKYVDGASLSESMTDGHDEYVEPECSSCENAKRRISELKLELVSKSSEIEELMCENAKVTKSFKENAVEISELKDAIVTLTIEKTKKSSK